MWLGGSVAVVAMAVYQQFLGGLSLAGLYLFGAVFIALATAGAIIPLRLGKWIPTSGAIGQIALLAFFTISVVLYGARNGVHGISVADLSPVPCGVHRHRPGSAVLVRRGRTALDRRRGDDQSPARHPGRDLPGRASARR